MFWFFSLVMRIRSTPSDNPHFKRGALFSSFMMDMLIVVVGNISTKLC